MIEDLTPIADSGWVTISPREHALPYIAAGGLHPRISEPRLNVAPEFPFRDTRMLDRMLRGHPLGHRRANIGPPSLGYVMGKSY
jgi:hypothetical protein